MPLKRITLRLARNPGLPDGDNNKGYVLVAPLEGDDEAGYRLGEHKLANGEYGTIRTHG